MTEIQSTKRNKIDPQALNDIKAISAQITATSNPAELKRLANQAQSLKSDNKFVNDIIEKIQNVIAKKHEAIEAFILSEAYTKDLEELQKQIQKQAILAISKEEIAQKTVTLDKSHNEFVTNVTKDIKRIEKSNNRLNKVIDKLEKENIFDHEELHHEILTHEEILAQNEKHNAHYAHQKIINDEHAKVHHELNELNKEITNVKQRLQSENLTSEKIDELKQELEFHQEMLIIRKPYAEQLNKAKKETDQKIEEYKKARNAQGEKIRKLGDIVERKYTKDSEEYNKYEALKRQHEAIEKNGEVKDKEHHDKVLANINVTKSKSLTDKIREQHQVKNPNIGSLCPSRTPNNTTNNKTRGI